MATIEIEKLIHQLEPKYLQELRHYLEYLLFVQDKEAKPNKGAKEKPATKPAEPTEPAGEDVPERLKALKKFAGTARFPDYPTSKYDVYEQ